jgi:RNA polymerase sigma factor (sigma-70 family)
VRDTPVPGDAASRSAEREALWQLVVALPPRQRTVIVLRYYEDFDDATIAEVMNCSPGTVRTQAKRALATLQQKHLSVLCASEGGR